jgi:hypothetical protein
MDVSLRRREGVDDAEQGGTLVRMRLIAALILLAFALAPAAEAAPKWLKRAVEYSIYAAPVVTSILATHEGHLCRA